MKRHTVTPQRIEPNPSYPGYVIVTIVCPHCGKTHRHGGAADDYAGDRVSHCHRGHYVIAEATP